MNRLLASSVFLLFAGCSGAANTVLYTMIESDTAYNNLAGLRVGMTQQAAWTIMREPEWEEQVNSPKGMFCIWYYLTRPSLLGQARYLPRNFTPVVFQGGKLIGWGWHYYDIAIQRGYHTPKGLPAKPEPLNEDIELEKTLEAPSYPKQVSVNQQPSPAPEPEYTPNEQIQEDGPPDEIEEEATQAPTPNRAPAIADDGTSPPAGFDDDDEEENHKPTPVNKAGFLPTPLGDSQTPSTPSDEEEQDNGDPDQRDREMMDDETEENFNFW